MVTVSTFNTLRPHRRTNESGNVFLWGCAALVALTMFIMLAIFIAAYFGISAIRKYTSEEPIILPPVDATIEEINAVIERVDTFGNNLDKGQAQESLILTQKDLNILIQHHEELEEIEDYVYLTLEDDEITGQLSVPLDFIPGLRNRYFTGVATFEIEFENQRLEIYVNDAEVNGEAVSEKAMEEIRQENLADELVDGHPELRDHLRNLESIEVVDGQVIIIPRK